MCSSCDAWVAERHDPAWKPPKGKAIGRVKRPRREAAQPVGWSGKTRRESS